MRRRGVHNPRALGIGIDEDTAIVVEHGRFQVIGAGAIYVVDASGVTHSNIAEARSECALSMYDVRLHVLSKGDEFELEHRRPAEVPATTGRELESQAPFIRREPAAA